MTTVAPQVQIPDAYRFLHDSGSGLATPIRATRDRPLLSPAGRKLRHLSGIAIRNITFKPFRARRRSNDDENLSTTWRSPAKLHIMKEEPALKHAKSAIDLSSLAAESSKSAVASSSSSQPTPDDQPVTEESRPPLIRPRRSTRANSILAGTIFEKAATRQRNLEDATLGRLVDSFFTLHSEAVGEEPFYISEVEPLSTNPDFQNIDLSECGPGITRLDSVSIRIWARKQDHKNNSEFSLLIELNIALSYLQFIGPNLEACDFPFPENCVVFLLSDGCYTVFSELDPKLTKIFSSQRSRSFNLAEASTTCSFDAIMKLKNLEECIYDAKETQAVLERQMNTLAEQKSEQLLIGKNLEEENLGLVDVKKTIQREKKRLEALRRHRTSLWQSIDGRKAAIAAGAENRQAAKKHLLEAKQHLQQSLLEANMTAATISSQRRLILDELIKIFPIEHIPSQPLDFTICNLHLPNETPEGHNEDVIAAALGYTAHLVYMLSLYLSVYLRYPIIPKGSSSMIFDPISIIQGSRYFPLWAKGMPFFRFEYALFLLNRNIEQLMESQKCIVLDVRQTLPNLKYLLYVATASKTPMSFSHPSSSSYSSSSANHHYFSSSALSPMITITYPTHPPPSPVLTTVSCSSSNRTEERPAKPFGIGLSRKTAAALAESDGGAGLLSRSLPKSTKSFTSLTLNGSDFSFKHNFHKSQDV